MTTTSLSTTRPGTGASSGASNRAEAARAERPTSFAPEIAFVAAHVPLAFVLAASPLFATVHALVVLAAGFHFLRFGRAHRIAFLAAYIVGAEVLWRGTEGSFVWELAKYSLSGFFLLALVRYRVLSWTGKAGAWYFALLLPSLAVLPYFDRREISFALSGPLSLGLAMMFFSRARFSRQDTVRIFLVGLAPIVSLATLSVLSTLRADPEAFWVGGTTTTAGIGPNQVSAALGLGTLFAFYLFLLLHRSSRGLAQLGLALAVVFGLQALLSFSRGGIWGTLGTLAVMSWFLLKSRRARGSLIVAIVVLAPLLHFWILPAADQYTRGLALSRFTETDLTGRDRIMLSDLRAFQAHPWVGLGPGQSDWWHFRDLGVPKSAHTEYTRAIAEHGLLGLIAMSILIGVGVRRLHRDCGPLEKALVVALSVWTLLYLGHSAMRLAAPGFVFGLGGARFDLDQDEGEAADT